MLLDCSQQWCCAYSQGIDPVLGHVQGIENKRTRELSEEELTNLREEVDKYTVEGDLRRFNALNIKRLRDIGCYRGRRHAVVQSLCAHLIHLFCLQLFADCSWLNTN